MNKEETLLKQLETYFNLEFNQFDKDRILGYLTEYLNKLPPIKPQVITEQKVIYKYIKEIKNTFQVNDNGIPLIEPKEVIEVVTKISGIAFDQLKGKRRDAEIIIPRHISMYLIKELCHETLKRIGDIFNRDHTSVINAIRHVREMLETEDVRYIKLVQQASSEFSAPIKKTA